MPFFKSKKKRTRFVDDWRTKSILRSADLLLKYRRPSAAIKYCDRILASNPSDFNALKLKALCLYEIGKYEDSLRLLKEAIAVYDGDAEIYEYLAFVYRQKKDLERAVHYIDCAISINPENPMTWTNKATFLIAMGRYEEAMECIEYALKLDDTLAVAWNNKGVIYSRTGRYNNALECYQQAIHINPCYVGAIYNRGVINYKMNHLDAAETDFLEVLKLNPCDTLALNNLSIIYMAKGKFHMAKKYLLEALKYKQRSYITYNNLGVLYMEIGDYKNAEHYIKMGLKMRPRDADLWNNLGLLYEKIDDIEHALEALQKAMKYSNARDFEILNNYAGMLAQTGRIKAALDHIKIAIEAQTSDPDLWFNRAYLEYMLGDYASALKSAMRAMEYYHEDVDGELHLLLGDIYLGLHDFDNSRTHYVSAYKIFDDTEKRYEVQAHMCVLYSKFKMYALALDAYDIIRKELGMEEPPEDLRNAIIREFCNGMNIDLRVWKAHCRIYNMDILECMRMYLKLDDLRHKFLKLKKMGLYVNDILDDIEFGLHCMKRGLFKRGCQILTHTAKFYDEIEHLREEVMDWVKGLSNQSERQVTIINTTKYIRLYILYKELEALRGKTLEKVEALNNLHDKLKSRHEMCTKEFLERVEQGNKVIDMEIAREEIERDIDAINSVSDAINTLLARIEQRKNDLIVAIKMDINSQASIPWDEDYKIHKNKLMLENLYFFIEKITDELKQYDDVIDNLTH